MRNSVYVMVHSVKGATELRVELIYTPEGNIVGCIVEQTIDGRVWVLK